ncbi:hypothetical protein [Clostridium thermarum]|uniref:hypothetical protein n=1 Tax=Clostridium thermarum TaxID=1716543 RepID=UPI0011235095|nr:hypothetical protein [Clostridium thermarum]
MLKVTGHSDDLIVIEGEIREEFGRYNSEEDYLAFSDGTVLRAYYDEDGLWRFIVVFKGSLFKEKIEGNVQEDINDLVTFHAGIVWCVCGKDLAKK